MIARSFLWVAFLGGALAAGRGEAKEATATFDPAKTYVVVEVGQLDGAMIQGGISLARYDAAKGDVEHLQPERKGARQVRVYRQGKSKQIVKDRQRRLILIAVEPGLWTVEGANDTAFSLGSSTFRVEAGSITDLGVANIYTDFPEGEKRRVLTAGNMFTTALAGGLLGGGRPPLVPKAVDFRPRTTSDLQLPASMAVRASPVVWTGEVHFGNYLGGLVNRMGGRKARYRELQAEQQKAIDDSSAASAAPAAPSSRAATN